jgi:2-desacetyl-2-hydroxyethyl bacteriochlorophyllide A dehydrogenase
MPSLHPKRVVFTGKQQAALESFAMGDPAPDEILVEIRYSLMSTGTENIVFNQLYDPGTHWDRWVKFPFHPGYAATGVVLKTGRADSRLKPGDPVACRAGHRSHAVVQESACYPIPAGLPLEDAAWFALAKITFNGAMAAGYRLGDRVLVIGAGPIGQMSLRWARACGAATVVVADPVPERGCHARNGGADAYIASPIHQAKDAILAAHGGEAPRVVIDSTGHAAVFAPALDLAATGGRVVILGDTGSPSQQALSSDVITKGLSIVGAHDGVVFPGWDEASITALFYKLVRDGRYPLARLNTHRFKPEACAEAYATANRERAKTMGIQFDWNG